MPTPAACVHPIRYIPVAPPAPSTRGTPRSARRPGGRVQNWGEWRGYFPRQRLWEHTVHVADCALGTTWCEVDTTCRVRVTWLLPEHWHQRNKLREQRVVARNIAPPIPSLSLQRFNLLLPLDYTVLIGDQPHTSRMRDRRHALNVRHHGRTRITAATRTTVPTLTTVGATVTRN